MKILYDLKLKMKLVVSGSSSLELRAKISEHLTGRKHTFEMYPFNFEEFLAARKISFYRKKEIEALMKFHGSDMDALLKELACLWCQAKFFIFFRFSPSLLIYIY